jgi:peroxiredoxin
MQGIWLLAFIVQWVPVLLLALLVVGILRYLHSVQERWDLAVPAISKYEIRQKIDDFELPDMSDTKIKSRDVLRSSGSAILFVTPSCRSCLALLDQVSELVNRPDTIFNKAILIIVAGTRDQLENLLRTSSVHDSQQVILLYDEDSSILKTFGLRAIPTGLEVDREGYLISQTFNPHADHWLYKVVGVPLPEKPVVQGHVGTIVPTVLRHR